ncbi:MAG: DEAD/DEAH box helicase [Gammaproteobacteria bacterium]
MKITKKKKIKVPKVSLNGWNTTDSDEIERRRIRGQTEKFKVQNLHPTQNYFSSFCLTTAENKQYHIEIRSLSELINSCDCFDYRHNRLGTCKHIEHVLFYLNKSKKKLFKKAQIEGSPKTEIFLEHRSNRMGIRWSRRPPAILHRLISPYFSSDNFSSHELTSAWSKLKSVLNESNYVFKRALRVSEHIEYFVEYQNQISQKKVFKESFLKKIQAGKKSIHLLKHPLYSYQQEGALHLALNERALLADEMGLGKTIQAIAACELLRREKNVQKVLIIATASLKAEWEEQINKFTDLSSLIIRGSRAERLQQYEKPAFFYLMNYEQAIIDRQEIQTVLSPDVIVLDEAQRIKNWQSKTAQTIKLLKSPYAFILTGTPIENRIDDVYSITQFLDPYLFGALFRFNREFYQLDENGRPIGYKNLDELHRRLTPIMLRRQKSDVEGQLPKRTVNHYFVKMSKEQRLRYDEYQDKVARLVARSKKRPLRKEDFERLQRWLACMRMLCDTPYILDQKCRVSPKLNELKNILKELLSDESTKIIIFSEWVKMLELVREHAEKNNLEVAWHTGAVNQVKRRLEIKRFKEDPRCRLFLSTDCGSVGLNLQSANVVINLDLPWNPAKLEQRIARAWRKHQTRSVQVINLVCEDSIEHRMITLLSQKQSLAQSVLGSGELKEMPLPSSRADFIERLESLINPLDLTPKKDAILPEGLMSDLILLQAHQHAETGQRAALAVVNERINEVKSHLIDNLKLDPLHVEILDRDTYETINRLIKAGILSLSKPLETLHQLADPPLARKSLYTEKQLAEARMHFSDAVRKQRMAQLLLEGEFHEEALNPIHDALKSVVTSFSHLNGKQDDSNLFTDEFINKNLIEQHGFPEQAASLFSYVTDELNQVPLPHVKFLLNDNNQVIQYLSKRLDEQTN